MKLSYEISRILLVILIGSECYAERANVENKDIDIAREKREIIKTIKDNFIKLVTGKVKNKKNLYKVMSNFNLLGKDKSNFNTSEFKGNKKHKCSDRIVAKFMTTPQLTASHGYMSEAHTIVTDDGYILTVHRIWSSNKSVESIPKKTVLLHHGLVGSSGDWIIPGPGRGLPYILSDADYDVWLANARGNTYSKAHLTKKVNSADFWNFTIHEIGQQDLPAVIDYIILRKGGDVKINFVGYSLGTTVLFALLSTKPRYNEILRAGFVLGPVAYMTNIKAPFKLLSRFSKNINYLMKLTDGTDEFLPRNSLLKYLSKHSCSLYSVKRAVCKLSMFTICGHGRRFDTTLVPLIVSHMPAGSSKKTLIHYSQQIKAGGRFQMFDYGPKGNKVMYGESTPPEYPVNKITLPIAIFSAPDDWFSDLADATRLYKTLANPIEHYIVPKEDFNHIDFLYARDTAELVYKKLLELMDRPLPNEQ